MPVNPTKTKHLTNMRSQGDGKGIQLEPPLKMSLERAIEYIAGDEYVEATPKNLRLRMPRILLAFPAFLQFSASHSGSQRERGSDEAAACNITEDANMKTSLLS